MRYPETEDFRTVDFRVFFAPVLGQATEVGAVFVALGTKNRLRGVDVVVMAIVVIITISDLMGGGGARG